MSTGDSRTQFEQKRFLPQQRLEDSFFDYLNAKLDDLTARIWGGERGVFGAATLSADGNDKFKVAVLPLDLLDGDGNILTLDATHAEGVQFENAAAIVYYVGARFVAVPKGVVRNPRNDVIFYDEVEDEVGEIAEPDSVTEVAGTLEIVVDSVFEAGVSHAGRLVTVYLRVPATDVEAVAIERNLTVAWDGSNNKVVTSALLGQTGGSASTTVSDYQVVAQGVTVRRNTDLSATAPYAFLGTVTGIGAGSPPVTFSTTGQIDVSDGINPDLQEAYTVGRTITPSSLNGGAVKIASLDAGDALKALLHLDRQSATERDPLGLVGVNDEREGAVFAALTPLVDLATSTIVLSEAATVNAAAGVLDLTRGGAQDLTAAAAGLKRELDVAVLAGFATAAVNGMYLVEAVSANQVILHTFENAVPGTWPAAETGTVTFYRVSFHSGSSEDLGNQVGGTARPGLNAQNAFVGRPNHGFADDPAGPVVRIAPHKSKVSLDVLDEAFARKVSVNRVGRVLAETAGALDGLENAQVKLRRFGNVDYMQFMLVLEIGDASSIPIAVVQKVRGTAGIVEDNGVSIQSILPQVTFTGGGVDLLDDVLRLDERWNLIYLSDAPDPADVGLYAIEGGSITTTTLNLHPLTTGGNPSFGADGVGSASILQVLFWVGGSNIHPGGANSLAHLEGLTVVLRDGQQLTRPFRIHPQGAAGAAITIYDNAVLSEGYPDVARPAFEYHPDQAGVDQSSPFRFFLPGEFHGAQSGTGAVAFADVWALRLVRGGGGLDSAAPGASLYIDEGNVGTPPAAGAFKGGFTAEGVPIRGHFFRDDFFYDPATWSAYNVGIPSHYSALVNGASSAVKAKHSLPSDGCGGVVLDVDGSAPGNYGALSGPLFARISSVRGFQWRFNALVCPDYLTDVQVTIGLYDFNNLDLSAFFYIDPAVNAGRWTFRYQLDDQSFVNVDTGLTPVAGRYYWMQISQLGSRTWYWVIGDKSTSVTGLEDVGPASLGAPTEYNFANAAFNHIWRPYAKLQTTGSPGGIRSFIVDMWQFVDVGNPTFAQLFNCWTASPI